MKPDCPSCGREKTSNPPDHGANIGTRCCYAHCERCCTADRLQKERDELAERYKESGRWEKLAHEQAEVIDHLHDRLRTSENLWKQTDLLRKLEEERADVLRDKLREERATVQDIDQELLLARKTSKAWKHLARKHILHYWEKCTMCGRLGKSLTNAYFLNPKKKRQQLCKSCAENWCPQYGVIPTHAEMLALPIDSRGTCRFCGYSGPGPGHDCSYLKKRDAQKLNTSTE